MTALPDAIDALVIGAGPAGLAAAEALALAGLSTHVLERETAPGGIPRHCAHSPFGMREFGRPMTGAAYGAALARQAERAGAILHLGVTVARILPGGAVEIAGPEGLRRIRARVGVLATGARESSRAARLIGGTKPGGVMNTGALQGLVHLGRKKPFRRPLVVGSELVAFSALLTCRAAGARPVAMIEEGPQVSARFPAALLPRALGVPLRLNTRLVAIHGAAQVEGATIQTAGGPPQKIDCDGVVLTGRFRPENTLARMSHLALCPRTLGPEVDQWGRASDPAWFAAGNGLRGVETAGACWAEGRAVGRAAAWSLSGALPESPGERLEIEGDGILWALPQRLCAGGPPAALSRLQLRVARPVDAEAHFGRQSYILSARPDRRVTLPLPPAPPAGGLHLRIAPR